MKKELEKYNGWTNQATWALNLDLSNTEALYYKYMNIAEQGLETFKREALRDIKAGLLVDFKGESRHDIKDINFKEVYETFKED